MKTWRINKRHKNSHIEECTRVTLEADTPQTAVIRAQALGYTVLEVNPIFQVLSVEA